MKDFRDTPAVSLSTSWASNRNRGFKVYPVKINEDKNPFNQLNLI